MLLKKLEKNKIIKINKNHFNGIYIYIFFTTNNLKTIYFHKISG